MRKLIILILTIPLIVSAQEIPRWNRLDKILALSQGTLTAATIADVHSSQRGFELNPIARGKDGKLNNRASIIIVGSTIGLALLQRSILKRIAPEHQRKWKKVFVVLNLAGTASHGIAAGRNYRIER